MIVRVGDQALVVPLAHVVECVRERPEEVAGLGRGRSMLDVRGRFIPILPLEGSVGAERRHASEAVLIVVDTEALNRLPTSRHRLVCADAN